MNRSEAKHKKPAKGHLDKPARARPTAPPHPSSALAALLLAVASAAYRWGWGYLSGGADLDATRSTPWPEIAATCVCLPASLVAAVTAFLMALHILRQGESAHRRVAIAAIVVASVAILPWFLMLRPA